MKKLLIMGLTAMLAAVMCVSFTACDIFGPDGGSNTGNGEESGQPIESGKDDEQNTLVSEKVTKDVWDAAFTSIREETIENYKIDFQMEYSVHYQQGKYRELIDTQKRVGVNVKDGENLYMKTQGANVSPMVTNAHGTEREEEGCYDSENEVWYVKGTDKWVKENSPEWELGDFGEAFEIMADDRYEWGYDAFSYSDTEKAYVLDKNYDLDGMPFVGKQSLKFGDGKIVTMEFVTDSIEVTGEDWFNRTVVTFSMTVVYGGQTVTLPTPDQIVEGSTEIPPLKAVSERVTKDVWDEAFAAFYEGRIENYKADFEFDMEVWGKTGDGEYHGTQESSGINIKSGDDKYMETIMTSAGYMSVPGEQAGALEKGYYDSRRDCWYKQVAGEWIRNASAEWETLSFNEFFAFVVEIAEWNYDDAEFSAKNGYVLKVDINEDDGDIVATGKAELRVCFKDGKIISLECIFDARSHSHGGETQTVHYRSAMTVVYGGQEIPSIVVAD